MVGLASGSTIYGTGYAEAKGLLEGSRVLPQNFGALKCLATIISYISGIPGGIFAPSLSVGAGMGSALTALLPGTPVKALILLSMVGYFTGVVQAPLTAVPLMATALVSYMVSKLVCPRPLYRTLSQFFIERCVRRGERSA